MSLLSDDVEDGDWRVELGMYIASLHADPSQERFDIIDSICCQKTLMSLMKFN